MYPTDRIWKQTDRDEGTNALELRTTRLSFFSFFFLFFLFFFCPRERGQRLGLLFLRLESCGAGAGQAVPLQALCMFLLGAGWLPPQKTERVNTGSKDWLLESKSLWVEAVLYPRVLPMFFVWNSPCSRAECPVVLCGRDRQICADLNH